MAVPWQGLVGDYDGLVQKGCSRAVADASGFSSQREAQVLLLEEGFSSGTSTGSQQEINFSELKGLLVVPVFTSVVTGVVWLAGGEEEFTSLPQSYCRKKQSVAGAVA